MSKTQQLLAAATPAPWGLTQLGISVAGDYGNGRIIASTLGPKQRHENAALIVHLRNNADAAQAVIEAARALDDFMENEFVGYESHDGGEVGTWHAAALMVQLEDVLGEKLHAALAAYDEADRG